MKWLAAGLTFVNVATVCGLLFGMVAGGLNRTVAVLSFCVAALVGALAYAATDNPYARPKVTPLLPAKESKRSRRKRREAPSPQPPNYKIIWLWLIGACFAIFAFRSFCWLLYIDGGQLKIQSPNNLGDIALHLTYIRNFANGVALWPENPIFTLSRVRYPAGVDLFNALLVCLGMDIRKGLIWVGLLASLATFYAFWRWGGVFGIAGFLFNGGMAGFKIFQTFKWLDYQGVPSIAWKSIPLAMLVTQRGLLYAIPAGLLLLCHWRTKFFPAEEQSEENRSRVLLPFWVECSLYASMPLFHIHTFMALSIVLAFIFIFKCLPQVKFVIDLFDEEGIAGLRALVLDRAKWGNLFGDTPVRHLAILVASAFLPATFLIWLITDHFQASSVLEWHPGWVQNSADFAAPFFQIGPINFWAANSLRSWLLQRTWNGVVAPAVQFWLPNFGILIPLVLLLIGLCSWRAWRSGMRSTFRIPVNLAFLIPASAIFIFACLMKTAPWDWDNIKLIIWAYFIVLPFLWRDLIANWPVEITVPICIALFSSGFVSLIGGLAAPGFDFANREEVDSVAVAVRKLPAEARFASFPIYNHPLLLNGRNVVLGYTAHLWTQGFEYADTEEKLSSLMNGTADWRQTARSLQARYLFWGREEKVNYAMSSRPWEQAAPCIATGSWGAIYDLEPAQSRTAASD